MTKTKQAIKEANKMADLALLKSKVQGYIKTGIDWLDTEFYGHKRGKIIFIAAIVIMAIVQVS